MTTTANTMEVWYLLIDHEKKPLGQSDIVHIPPGAFVGDLKRKIKEDGADIAHHFNREVAAAELVVWRCRNRNAGKGSARVLKNDIKDFIFSEESVDVEKVDPMDTVEDLDLAPKEMLIVQLPRASHITSFAHAPSSLPQAVGCALNSERHCI